MTWTKLSDDFCDRDDLLNCSRSARLLYVELLVYGNRIEKDGRIPRARLARFSDCEPEALNELIAAGIVTEEGTNLLVDWSDQERSEDVRSRRRYRAETQAKYRKRKAAHARDDHDDCDPRYCDKAVTSNASNNTTGNETPSRPSRPQQGQGQGGHDGSATASPSCPDCGLNSGRHIAECGQLQVAS